MRLLFSFSLVLFFATTSIGQSFTLPELIKMSKMDTESFDTYVTTKDFVYSSSDKDDNYSGVTYAFEVSKIDITKASKFITLYQSFFDKKYSISYQTSNKKEYLNIKNQVKVLGFKLVNSEIFNKDEITSNHFEYRKGKAKIDLYATPTFFEIGYYVSY